jgi:retinol dehydrogenase 14
MKTFVVTGATDGIGLETARQLLALGHRVLIHGRTAERANAAALTLGSPAAVFGDLSQFREVRALAKQVEALTSSLDGLINNAGVYLKSRAVSVDGFEMTMAVNYLAPFLLTQLLLPLLHRSPDARVVHVSAALHTSGRIDLQDFNGEKNFSGPAAYTNSKLAQVLFSRELARRTTESTLTSLSLHPGVVTTKMLKSAFGMTGVPVQEGARTSVFCSTEEALKGRSGKYYTQCRETHASGLVSDERLGAALWDFSLQAVGLAP